MKKLKIIIAPHDAPMYREIARRLRVRGCEVAMVPLYWRKAVLLDLARIAWLALFKRYRVLHLQWLFHFPTMRILKAEFFFFKLLGLKLAWTIHNVMPHIKGSDDRERGRWLYHHADGKSIHYESNIPDLENVLGVDTFDNLHIIPHPPYSLYPNEISRREARKKLGIDEDKKVLLGFGGIRPNRGYEYFMDAMEILGNEYLGVIVGKAVCEQTGARLAERAESIRNLRLELRYVDDSEVQVYMNACDVVVLPYTRNTTSGVAMLAFEFSRPVVATALGSLPDMVEEGTGIVVPPCDAEQLAGAIRKIFTMDPPAMGRYAHALVEQKSSWNSIIDKTIRLYESL
ncbi:glycosyltransferase family 4 protein [Thermodesulfobacteriota bacterium]